MRKFDKIKNFSTSIDVYKTIAEIEKILSMHGATKIMKEFDNEGMPNSLSFMIYTQKRELPIKLPVHIDRLMGVFKRHLG